MICVLDDHEGDGIGKTRNTTATTSNFAYIHIPSSATDDYRYGGRTRRMMRRIGTARPTIALCGSPFSVYDTKQ